MKYTNRNLKIEQGNHQRLLKVLDKIVAEFISQGREKISSFMRDLRIFMGISKKYKLRKLKGEGILLRARGSGNM